MDTETQITNEAGAAPGSEPTATPMPEPMPAAMMEPTIQPTWGPTPAPVPTSPSARRRGVGGTVVALVAVAALASGGTVGTLAAVGALDRPSLTVVQAETPARNASVTTPAAGAAGTSPVAAFNGVNDAVINAASKVSPAVVTIVSSTSASTGSAGGSGAQGVNPFGNGQNPFGNGQNPFGNGQNPFGQGNGSQGNGSPGNGDGQNGNGGTQGNGTTPTIPNQNGAQGNGGSGQNLQPYGIPQGQTPVSVGSGVIFDANGWILTNHHVVADVGTGTLTVQLQDGRSFPAKVYGVDTLTDLAIVKIDATGLPTANLGDSSALKVGQLAIAVGDPLGEYPGTVTTGVVSGIGRSISDQTINLSDLIQTDAAINPGNSGGPLVDENGAVVGIDTAIAGSAQGIGFAIPINVAKPIMAQALAGQTLSRPWLGVRYTPLDTGIATRNNLSVSSGAWITAGGSGAAVEAGSPAATAGLQENDVITAVNGTAVDTNHPLVELLGSHAPGETVTLTIRRGSADTSVQVTLTTRQATTN